MTADVEICFLEGLSGDGFDQLEIFVLNLLEGDALANKFSGGLDKDLNNHFASSSNDGDRRTFRRVP